MITNTIFRLSLCDGQFLKPDTSGVQLWPTNALRGVFWALTQFVCSYSLPGVKKALGQYGPAGVEDTTSAGGDAAADEDDDDMDLFGSDEEACLSFLKLFLPRAGPLKQNLMSYWHDLSQSDQC